MRIERRVDVGTVAVRFEEACVLVAAQEFDRAVLVALEARRPAETAAKRAVFAGRKRRQHVPSLHELGKDAPHARQSLEGGTRIVGRDASARAHQLVDRELHPQFARLVLDDEEKFVGIARARMLRRQDGVEIEIVAVAHLAGEIRVRVVLGARHHVTFARVRKRGSS